MTFGAMRAALSRKEILFGDFSSTQRLGHLPQAGSGTNIVTAQTSVAVVNGVAAGWNVLDDFQTYNAGSFVNPYWSDLSGGSTVSGQVIANKIKMSGSSRIIRPPITSP